MKTARMRYPSLTATAGCAAVSLFLACNDAGVRDQDTDDAGGARSKGGTTSVGGSSAGEAGRMNQGGNAATAGATASGGTAGSGAAPGGGTGGGACGGCTATQVCSEGQCVDLPTTCPCPLESYCNLATSSCVAGCTSDEDCAAERLCNVGTRECFDGCHLDADCSGGRACREAGCVIPCASHAECPAGQVCEGKGCRAGCRDASGCAAGETCDLRLFQCTGRPCGSDAECDLGTLCNPATSRCEYGCQLNGTTLGTSADRCRTGQTCMRFGCTPEPCFACDQGCGPMFSTECKDGDGADYECTSFTIEPLCARVCSETADCGSGEVCVTVSANRRCVPSCSSDAQCAAARPVGSGPIDAACFCRPNGICHDASEQECQYHDWPAR